MTDTLDKLNAISQSLNEEPNELPAAPPIYIDTESEDVPLVEASEPEHRVQLPVHQGESAIEQGPATFKCGQLASMVSTQEAIAYMLNVTIDIDRKETVDAWLNECADALWKIVESISGGAGKRSPAPIVRKR